MEKVRVLEIIGKRPVGGVGTVMLQYQQYIDAEKVQMDYLIFGEEEESFDKRVKSLGSNVYTYPSLSGRQMGKTRQYFEVFFKEHKGEYDIVHLHAPNIAFLCLPIAEKYGIRHRIVHSHATLYAENKIKAIRNKVLWSIAQKSITDRIGCSKMAGDFLFRDKPFMVQKNAIDYEQYLYEESLRAAVRKAEDIPDGKLVVGNVGRFSLQKNQTYLIDIFAELKKIRQDAVLWLVGDGETKDAILQKIKEHHLIVWDAGAQEKPETYDVKLFGMVSNARELYQAMDVMVMPSLFEGLPMVGVEAQASGLPCVFSDAVTREVDVAEAKYLSLKQSPKKWAEAAVEAGMRAGRRSYPKELDELGFNIKLEAKRLEELYFSMK